MKAYISDDVAAAFPELLIGVIRLDEVDNRKDPDPLLRAAVAQRAAELRAEVGSPDEVPELAAWQRAYRAFGSNPRRHRPSAEALVRQVLKGGAPPSISPLVDCYLYISLLTFLPIGGYDLDAVDGDVVLRTSPGNEPFVALGGAVEVTEKGEVVYADDTKVLTRRWNHRDGELSKLDRASNSAVLFCESPGGIQPSSVGRACYLLAEEARRWTGATTTVAEMLRAGGLIEV
jgi:DNA/RNA-binding domain of Phe-tRNA-synthetase-like protein